MKNFFKAPANGSLPIYTMIKVYGMDHELNVEIDVKHLEIQLNAISINHKLFMVNNDKCLYNFIIVSSTYNYESYMLVKFGRYFYLIIKSLVQKRIQTDKLWMMSSTTTDGIYASFSTGNSIFMNTEDCIHKTRKFIRDRGDINLVVIKKIFSSSMTYLVNYIKLMTMEYGNLYIPGTTTKNPAKILVNNEDRLDEDGYINSVISKGLPTLLPRYVTPVRYSYRKMTQCHCCKSKNSWELYFLSIGYCKCKKCGSIFPVSYNEAMLKTNTVA